MRIRSRSNRTYAMYGLIPGSGSLLLVFAIAYLVLSGSLKWPSNSKSLHDQTSAADASSTFPRDSEEEMLQKLTMNSKENSSAAVGSEWIDDHLREQLSVVSDRTLEILKREMPAYWSMLKIVANSSIEELEGSIKKTPTFHELFKHPDNHRASLGKFNITVRKVICHPTEDSSAATSSKVYEIWGNTEQSKAWLYVFVTDHLPDGFDEGSLVNQQATVVGFFFKILAYYPGTPSKDSKALAAPMIIGKVSALPKQPTETPSILTPSLMISVCLTMTLGFSLYARFRTSPRKSNSGHDWSWLN